MFICKTCGELFDTAEVKDVGGDRGEYFGFCPFCGSANYVEAKKCRYCDEWKDEAEVEQGYCFDCLAEIGYDDEICWRFGEENKVDVPVNGLYAYLFTDEEIDTILFEASKKWIGSNRHKNYWKQDPDAFARFIKKEQLKEANEK